MTVKAVVAFRFSQEERKQLYQRFKGRTIPSVLVAELEYHVRLYEGFKDGTHVSMERFRKTARSLKDKLGRFAATLSSLSHSEVWDLETTELERRTDSLLEELSAWLARRSKPGPRTARWVLENGVGGVLADHGIDLSTYERGDLAFTLRLVWKAKTGERLPKNLRDTLRRVRKEIASRGTPVPARPSTPSR